MKENVNMLGNIPKQLFQTLFFSKLIEWIVRKLNSIDC